MFWRLLQTYFYRVIFAGHRCGQPNVGRPGSDASTERGSKCPACPYPGTPHARTHSLSLFLPQLSSRSLTCGAPSTPLLSPLRFGGFVGSTLGAEAGFPRRRETTGVVAGGARGPPRPRARALLTATPRPAFPAGERGGRAPQAWSPGRLVLVRTTPGRAAMSTGARASTATALAPRRGTGAVRRALKSARLGMRLRGLAGDGDPPCRPPPRH
jgi:hypothetical protein